MTPPLKRASHHPQSLVSRIVALWNQGHTQDEIGAILSIPGNTAGSYVGRARRLLGIRAVPHRVRGPVPGKMRTPTPLDRLRAVGDTVIVSKAEVGTRQNVHQNAETRGWKVRMRSVGETWTVTAIGIASTRVPGAAE